MLVPIAAVLFAFGYVLQARLINPFITRPEHSQFLLLVAMAIIIVNVLLIVFGPDAQNVQTSYAFDSFQIGPLIVDATKLYAGARRHRGRGRAVRLLPLHAARHRDPRLRRQLHRRAGGRARRQAALCADLRSRRGLRRRRRRDAAADRSTSRRRSGPAYTLLAFVIVITGGLGSMPGALLGGVLIGLTEAMAGLLFTPSAKSMFAFAHPGAGAAVPPAGHHGQEGGMIARLIEGVPRRALVLLGVLLVALIAAPLFAGDYLLTVLILILYFAYIGQAWNIMMGFAGQLSLGHALYVGLGAYTAAALYVHFGIGPWLGLLVAMPVAALAGAFIGFLAFRFRVAGVYFAILTIAVRRIRAHRLRSFELDRRLGRPVPAGRAIRAQRSLAAARPSGDVLLRPAGRDRRSRFVFCRALLQSRIGYFWLAIREDEEAARSAGIDTFRYKMIAVVISAGMTSFAGVFYAFYYNNLFPEQVFHISRSIEIILGPIIGGVGTLFGPILGAFVLTGLAETLTAALGCARRRSARRQAGVLRRLPAAGDHGAAGRRVAVARARASA